MKNILILFIVSLTPGCSSDSESPIRKEWLKKTIYFDDIQEVVNTYHMIDSTGTKIGSMIFGTQFSNGMLVSKDTSQFDDGSVYETARFELDTSVFKMKKVNVQLKTRKASLDIQLEQGANGLLNGKYSVRRDTSTQTYSIDTTYQFDVFRSEIYMLLQTLPISSGDTIGIGAMVPTRMNISNSMLIYSGEESISTSSGTVECYVISLITDGKMPENKIWISKAHPRTLTRFYIPDSKLTIELVEQKFK